MTIDAAGIARLREQLPEWPSIGRLFDEIRTLRDELEKARAEVVYQSEQAAELANRLTAKRDSAHALLQDIRPFLGKTDLQEQLRARIADALGDKP